MVDDRPHNYGKLYILFKNGNWIKGRNKEFDFRKGYCYCLATGLFEVYKSEEEVVEVRGKLIDTIMRMFPDRTSFLMTKIKRETEPMSVEQYSLVGFNDNPKTTFEDVMSVIIEAQV